MSKPKHAAWNHALQKSNMIQCIHCRLEIYNNITKFQQHLSKCPKYREHTETGENQDQHQLNINLPSDNLEPSLNEILNDFIRKGKQQIKDKLDMKFIGPFKVLKREENIFTIDKDGKQEKIHISRIIPAIELTKVS